jgi:hypothetical protein
MTTIAYRNGIMASDSRATINGYIEPQEDPKLFRQPDGGVAAMTGSASGCFKLLSWVNGDRKRLQPNGDYRIIWLRGDGRLEIFEDGCSYFVECEFMAWGSGMVAALGALHMGATAEMAVHVAAKIDTLTGGKVVTMQVEK